MLGEGSSVSPAEDQKVSRGRCVAGDTARGHSVPGGERRVGGRAGLWFSGLPGSEEMLNALTDAQKTAEVK